jgi:hypothetical protein
MRGETKIGISRPVLIHLPLDMLRQLDAAADAFEMCRADVIRRSLRRDLSSALGDEVQSVLRKKTTGAESSSALVCSSGRWRWLCGWLF